MTWTSPKECSRWHKHTSRQIPTKTLRLIDSTGQEASRGKNYSVYMLFNRPGVAGVVLQTPSSMIHSFNVSLPFPPSFENIINHKLKHQKNVCPPQHVPCQKSRVTCHVSHVTRHFLCVICNFFGQFGEGYWWRTHYPRGLPHLI